MPGEPTHRCTGVGSRAVARTRLAVSTACALLALLAGPDATAYRPFDSTDADVAAPGEFELELGPLGYRREDSARYAVAPAAAANFGVAGDREWVIAGEVRRALDNAGRSSVSDTGVFVKEVLRRGELQGEAGPSLAAEYGVLLPSVRGEAGSGASGAMILSRRLATVTVHLNGALAISRDHRPDAFVGAIVEGSERWALRPAVELTAEQESGQPRLVSRLVAAIWRTSDDLSFDMGVRRARSATTRIDEVRLGLTWRFDFRR
jgi:hypothetical protein